MTSSRSSPAGQIIPQSPANHGGPILRAAVAVAILAVALYSIVIAPLGPSLTKLPGSTDTRLNYFILEHSYRWLTGLEPDLWTAPSYYPYPSTIAFGDNFLGSLPFYALLRFFGLGRESAFQGWYIVGYCINYLVAFYVLSRFGLSSLPSAAGACVFAFGLPMLAQDGHVQLLYRFPVPLACYFLWRFHEVPSLRSLTAALAAITWQFYLSIYIGVFLLFLFLAMIVLFPASMHALPLRARLAVWPSRVASAFLRARPSARLFGLCGLLALAISLLWLLAPYYVVSSAHGFSRSWDRIQSMLPRWQSYFLTDRSIVWAPLSKLLPPVPMRHEHQLFPGAVPLLLSVIALVRLTDSYRRTPILLHARSALALVMLTLSVGGASVYMLIWKLPGLNSLQAITRIALVLLWPLSFMVAAGTQRLLDLRLVQPLFRYCFAFLLTTLLLFESILTRHATFAKGEAQARLDAWRELLPPTLPVAPVLVVAAPSGPSWPGTELDGMLLAQDLGWHTLNGFGGNFPVGYGPQPDCSSIPRRVLGYMDFASITGDSYYAALMDRVVPLGFQDCDPDWWLHKPQLSSSKGALPSVLLAGVRLAVLSLGAPTSSISARIKVTNQSDLVLPALSASGNPFRLSWRLVRAGSLVPLSPFESRRDLPFDVPSMASTTILITLPAPQEPGRYLLEVAAVQERLAWLAERGVPNVRSTQQIVVSPSGAVQIEGSAIEPPLP